ncbi:alpha/beta-hydrolase [Diplogelasinospora grovesii]|uniref:Alpha/beta-hydrolase n=1 Tax=Diplogelasinospora grovesii TaxID=303347 RepID=A0AAN6S6A3_9PEZI|nr:alpha/beta-hydrolase [Diplogelasinospora grovesii]
MSSAFEIKEHKVEAQHIREYAHATANSQEEVLYLSVKQYIPKSNPNPKPGDVTIIASHANGFVKEIYEPLWEDLVNFLSTHGIRVRGIWIADVAHQGQSGIINEDKLGNDPSWLDHARDLLLMTNHFRGQMPRPMVGVGHSFGANIIVNLALLHPRLLNSLILLDPVLSNFRNIGPKYGFGPLQQSAVRRDLWPSREEAVASFKRNRFYQTWDPRVLECWNKHGLRDIPTALYPDAKPGSVTLTTSKHQECFTYYRPQSQVFNTQTGLREKTVDRSRLLDAGDYLAKHPEFKFYRPEGPLTTERLPNVRAGVLWVFGETSGVNTPDIRKEKMDLTGVGVGGSGGAKAGRVKEVVMVGYGHLVPMEATTECARHAADFIAQDINVWRKEEEEYQAWAKRPQMEKQVLDEEWMGWLGVKEKAPKGKL